MNPATILQAVEHRPYPLPQGMWIMRQQWHELLFIHWPLAPEVLRPLLPPQMTLDLYEGEAWLAVVPFRMSHVSPRGLPAMPQLSAFPELNVRTYVTVRGIPGVYFFSLDAGNPIAVQIARSIFHLPYFTATMHVDRSKETIDYRSSRVHRKAPPAVFRASYRPVGPVLQANPGSLVHWFTERYCLYTLFKDRVYRSDIHHISWPLQAAELEIAHNTMAQAHGIQLPSVQPQLHYAEFQEVLVWPLHAAA